ncbi:hypothetical protein F5877DRAFT_93759 [Lentinula edodes]|nr:hypothetical protein F5877DRAFT_93759 [Lentinula edodes]
MKAFIRDLLGYDPNDKELTGGILGAVKGYYGCVEAQGRGTLHCHMMVWLEGSLNPNEIREKAMGDPDSPFCRRLIAFLDDTISNSVPAASSNCPRIPSTDLHPSSVRGTTMLGYHGYDCDSKEILQQDLHNLVHSCQVHKHTATCYKYCKDNSKPKECRFGLDDSNVVLESCFDPDTGELNLRCLDGLVNNFNETMLRAIRCNMDIKFIGSGASAKAVLYYITNYITKSQLKAHVAYAALERAVRRLDEQCPDDSELTIRAKKLLQKCAYSMISQQELSAQQVNTYLLDFEDHFTSHKYKNLYWVQIENLVENELPSPECQPARKAFENVLATFTGDPIDTTNEHESNDALAEDDHEVEDDEEVGIAVGVDGSLVAKASQVDDYRYRPVSVEDLCLWEQVAQCKKARKVRQNVDIKDFVDENEALEDKYLYLLVLVYPEEIVKVTGLDIVD